MNMLKRRYGQSLVEIAFVLPVFIFVFLGIIDFGRAFHAWSTINHMCVEASRVASKRLYLNIARNIFTDETHASPTDVSAEFWKFQSPLTPTANISGPTMDGVGEAVPLVRIRATFLFESFSPGMALMGPITLSATAVQRKE